MITKQSKIFLSQMSPAQSLDRKNPAGFTLIELLIAIVIIAILTVIGVGAFLSSQIKARDSARKADLKSISKALEMYYNDVGQYPESYEGKIVRNGTAIYDWGESFYNPENDDVVYMVNLPIDPNGKLYYYESDGSYFKLYALFENQDNPEMNLGGYSDTDCSHQEGIQECTFGVSSTNVALEPAETAVPTIEATATPIAQ